MAKALPLPDGTTVAIREGESPEQTWARAQQMYPEAFGAEPQKPNGPGPQSGFIPALKAGVSGLKSDVAALAGRSGIMDLAAAEKYRAEQEKYQAETFKPTQTWGEAPLTKFSELAGGALPYMAAPVAAGAAALALPEALAAAPILGGMSTLGSAVGAGAAGLASATQFAGSGLSRQVKEGTPLAETNLGSAVAAAIPSAALDMVSLKMMPGIRQIFAAAGKEVPEAVAKKIAEQGLKDSLKDYGVSALKTMGAEGLTETGQQVLERMQAGLSLTDPKARDEYLDSFIGGAVLGGTLAPVGRRFERGAEAQAQDKAATLKAAAQQQAEALQKQLETEQEQQRIAGMEAGAVEAPKNPFGAGPQGELPGMETQGSEFGNTQAAPGEEVAPVEPVDYHRQALTLKNRMEDLQTQASTTTDPAEMIALAEQHTQAAEAFKNASDLAGKQPKPLDVQLSEAQTRMTKAKELGDIQEAAKQAKKMLELRDQGAQDNALPMQKFKSTLTPMDKSVKSLQLIPGEQQGTANEAARARMGDAETQETEALDQSRAEEEQRQQAADRLSKDFGNTYAEQNAEQAPTPFGAGPQEELPGMETAGTEQVAPKEVTAEAAPATPAEIPVTPNQAAPVFNPAENARQQAEAKRAQEAADVATRIAEARKLAASKKAPEQRTVVPVRGGREATKGMPPVAQMAGALQELITSPKTSPVTKADAQRHLETLKDKKAPEAGQEMAFNFLVEQAQRQQRGLYRAGEQGKSALKPGDVQKLVDMITEGWKNAPKTVVHADESTLPQSIIDQAKADKMTGHISGVYDPNTKTVHMVESGLYSAQQVALTYAHEAAGHFGIREILGKQYDSVMDALYHGNATVRKEADAKLEKAPKLDRRIAIEEVLAEMAEAGPKSPEERSALRKIYDAIKGWVQNLVGHRKISDEAVQEIVANARKHVIEGGTAGKGKAGTAVSLYRGAKYTAPNALTELADTVIAKPKSFKERMGNNLGLEFEMQTTDMRAGLRESLKRGAAALGDDKLFTQAMYNVIKADQRMPLVQSVMTNGPLEMYTDAKGLKGWRSTNKNSAVDVFAAIAAIPGGNSQAKVNMATVYMIAQRAANKGASKLDIGALGVTQEKLDAAMAAVNADPELKKALEAARTAYNAYNEGMINALASTGAIPKATAATLLKDGDYVPFYRVNANGMADLVFSNEVTINIGDIRHQPYLAELKGGEAKIMPLNESLPRNTLLLIDKMLTNLATKNVAYAFQAMGAGKMDIKRGSAPAGPDIIKFNQEPEANDSKDNGQRWLRVNTTGTSMEGIPSELIVKSLEGSHLTLPAFLKIGGYAGDLLRAGVTRMPMYLVRQLIRDPMAASFTGGLNYGPLRAVAKAGKEFVAMSRGKSESGAKLMEKGLIQSGIFTGDTSDLSKMTLQIASGKDQGALDKLFAALDRAAMRADATTRVQVYDNAIANGLSEVEADMMTMESMNFHKRGLSPTVQYAARLIPFFNAQIQGLNVLYKAARGQMPFEEQQKIQRKFFNNGMLLVGTGIAYAMAMDDDEYFKNAKPKDKYNNFFLHVPGVAEPLKIPIPYEAGWFFSLAVAAADAMKAETDSKQQMQALRDMFLGAIPGYSSMGVPQAVKPVFEIWTNKNFFNGSAIESARMAHLSPQERFTAATTEAAKALSKALPMMSPLQIEHLATGYFGQLPLVIAGAADSLFRREGAGEAPESRVTEMPFVGQAFQKKFGGADTEVMYRDAAKALESKATFDKIRKEGRADDAKAFLADHRAEIASAGVARNYQTQMGRLRLDSERISAMPTLNAQEKRARLDKIEEARQHLADVYGAAIKRVEAASK